MKQIVGSTLVVLIAVVALGGCVALNYALWTECRFDHSVLYCMRVLGR